VRNVHRERLRPRVAASIRSVQAIFGGWKG
jgi:hypothetical protein